jgi:hypothetical protein
VSVIGNLTESLHALLHSIGPGRVLVKVTDVKKQTLGQSQDALAAILYKGTVTHKFPEVREPLRNGQGLEEKHLGTVRIHLFGGRGLKLGGLRKPMKGEDIFLGQRGFLKNSRKRLDG